MLAIKNNLMADNAARHLGRSYASLSKSVERLSSGLRINSAKDDAAGMAVSELVRADVATLKQGSRNASDGISMLQTAEGALGAIDDILVRMKELAEQSATQSYSDGQRDIMDAEFQQLAQEISRIATSTSFNGNKLLDSTASFKIHVGSADTIDFTAQKMGGDALGITKKVAFASNTAVTSNPAADFVDASAGAVNFTFGFGGVNKAVVFEQAGGTGGKYNIYQAAQAINTDAGYSAASVVYDSSTNFYTLKLSNSAGGAAAFAVTVGAGNLAAASWSETVGSNNGLSIKLNADAKQALIDLTTAITTKDNYRAMLGYMMNRLESATSVVDIQAENLMSAESRISDVDVAMEMAAMTRNQVLSQAGVSMLAQANQMPQMAMQLLRA